MSLLTDLQSLNLDGILNARASIRASVQAPGLQAVVSGGASVTALGRVGASLQALQTDFQNPTALFRPLVDAVSQACSDRMGGTFSDRMGGTFAGGTLRMDIAGVPVGSYAAAVREGATLMSRLFRGLSLEPESLSRLLNISLDEAVDRVKSVMGGFTQVGLGNVGQFRGIIETVEGGLPIDPGRFTNLALDVLLPFPASGLSTMRDNLKLILDGIGSLHLPQGRTAGLVIALDAVASAAATGDIHALERALRLLEQVRANTIATLRADLLAAIEQIDRLHLDRLLAPIVEASEALRTARSGILETLEDWQARLAHARTQVEDFDPAEVIPIIHRFVQILEEHARREVAARVDAAVLQLEEWIRKLLSHLPLRDLRNQISAFFHDVAQAIEDADLDRFAEAAHDALAQVEAALDITALENDVQAALHTARQAITEALGGVVAALETLTHEVNALAGQAEDILGRVANALEDFQKAMDAVATAVDKLGIEQAAQQVVQTLTTLRETAEKLLTVAPLPESMRPLVQQLIDTLNSVDFDVVFKPVRDAVAQFQIPDAQAQLITEALQTARTTIENLIPTELIASIEAEVKEVLDVIRDFDPSTLLSGVTAYIDKAADFLESLDPRPHVAEIRQPFQAVLDAIDAAHPRILLQPVIEAYDSLLGNIPLPAPETVVRQSGEALNAAGSRLGQAVAEPLRRAAPPGTVEIPADTEAGRAQPPPVPELDGVRPGDIIRFFGYLPAKLRQALSGLEAGPAGDILREIDARCAGLARNLRQLQGELWGMEARLEQEIDALFIPVGAAQLRAQRAIQANFSVGDARVNASLMGVAQAGPGNMRAALSEPRGLLAARARRAAESAGGHVGSALDRAADALERCRLSGLTGDLDALLAALDPEPIAAEFDAFVAAILRKAPSVLTQVRADIEAIWRRVQAILAEFNPGTQAQKFLVALNVLREELELLDPRRLADELGDIHAAIRRAIAAYDPAVLAADIAQTLTTLAGRLRALDPAALLGDLSFLNDIVAQVEAASPAKALAGVGASLSEVGQRLAKVDPAALLEAIERLGPRIVEEFQHAVEDIRHEIVALLEALRYAHAQAGVSVEVEASVG